MRYVGKYILLLLLIGIGMPLAHAQNVSTQGKEFWLSYMQNGYYENHTGNITEGMIAQLTISAKRDCQVSVTNPSFPNWSMNFQVQANSIMEQIIPKQYCYHEGSDNETVANKGIHIVATDTISVYCANIANYSFDASFVLPIDGLGDDYIIQCSEQSILNNVDSEYKRQNQTSAFLIVATEDNTVVNITPTVTTLGGHAAGQTYQVSLNAGQTYHVRSNNSTSQRDLTGTRVLADDCKRIAVFNGNTLTRLPVEYSGQGNTGFDHVFEQAMPTRSWGKRFVVTQSLTRNRDVVKIVSSANGNQIRQNGNLIVTLDAYEFYSFYINSYEQSCYIEATETCAVYLHNTSASDGKANGDPSIVWIAPIEQKIDEVTFATFTNHNASINNHYVNIIVKTEDIGQVTLDGNTLSPFEFSRVNGNQDYSFARKSINHGSHHLACPNGFNAHVYGFGDAKGYAYLVGSKAIDLSTHLTLNDVTMQPNESFKYCIDETVHFAAEVNFQEYDIFWDFGDGTTSTQNPVDHIYHDKRVYNVSVSITTEAGGCTSMNSDTTHFYVDATQNYIIENDAVCAGSLYSGYGFSNVMVNNDTILGREQDNDVFPECKDSVLVYVTAFPKYYYNFNESRCWHGEPGVYQGHGISFVYDHPGEYNEQLPLTTVNGCDSIINLHLVVDEQITYEFSRLRCGDTCVWDGRVYSEGGDYEWPYVTPDGCDSIVTMHLELYPEQHYEFDTAVCGSFVWNDIIYENDGTYKQFLNTQHGCDSIVTCTLTISEIYSATPITPMVCDVFEWNGVTYTESGFYSDTLLSSMQCDSILNLDLTILHEPDPSPIFPCDTNNAYPHWVITPTEFQINWYEFHLWDNDTTCLWDSVSWTIDTPSAYLWELQPDPNTVPVGKKCKVMVMNQVEDTVWLTATVFNKCSDPEGVSRRYWLTTSFYGLEEQETRPDFSIVPNPNNGQMKLAFEHLTGEIDIKVYDMKGILIDQFQTVSSTDRHSLQYTLKGQAKGIYLFVVSSQGRTLTKKALSTN